MDDAIIEEIIELKEDYFEDWNTVVEAIEDYSEDVKEAGIFDKGKTWLMITLIAALLGITTSEVLANPNENVKKLVTLYQRDIQGVDDVYVAISSRIYEGNTYYFVAFDAKGISKILDKDKRKQLAKSKVKLQHGIENPVFVSETNLGFAYAENERDADILRAYLQEVKK